MTFSATPTESVGQLTLSIFFPLAWQTLLSTRRTDALVFIAGSVVVDATLEETVSLLAIPICFCLARQTSLGAIANINTLQRRTALRSSIARSTVPDAALSHAVGAAVGAAVRVGVDVAVRTRGENMGGAKKLQVSSAVFDLCSRET